MEDKTILTNMVRLGFNDLYLEVVDAHSVSRALQDIYNMTEDDIKRCRFEIADKILQLALISSGTKKIDKEKIIRKDMNNTEIYQMWMGVTIILLFGASIMLLIYNPIPDGNNDLLVALVTWLGRDAAIIINYYHGSSYGSFIKTQSMLETERKNNEFDKTDRQIDIDLQGK